MFVFSLVAKVNILLPGTENSEHQISKVSPSSSLSLGRVGLSGPERAFPGRYRVRSCPLRGRVNGLLEMTVASTGGELGWAAFGASLLSVV